ncbi:molybdopterin-synthase adenylyltransferase MoeB [Salsipaludibacter albus]|uniref:molybdopterin-synthase adenylyltransferase MoeB n=1 Tax=Salsipaludibacter albus TaxID=2849650 RepID=UPI001EE3B32E|nr:molybdopterin-synthase adenylyltransferase MoeB [Salsipaludibacter albus]MBY5163979.1 molybdopterin-synthase adenylyltransferase MoeB [Salsipaludibacter albus]
MSIAPVVDRREPLTNDEIARYSRHLIIPDVAIEGQERLKAAKVLLVGTGGLGSPLALYLAAAGVGTIGLVDNDVVDASNLQRQVIHGTSDIGKDKLDSAEESINDVNPHVTVVKHPTFLDSSNAMEIIEPYDLVIDGTDNFPTRYLVNDACVLLGKPNVYGSIFRFEGQLSVFYAQEGPCYRCMFPEPPPPGMVPNCAEGGVLGIMAGHIGTAQGIEGIKLMVGIGDPMIGRLGLYDALDQRWTYVKVNKDPNCPVCGDEPTVTELIDYEEFCGMPAHDRDEVAAPEELEILPREYAEIASKPDVVLLDVREPHEYEINRIPGSVLIPKDTVPGKLDALDPTKDYVVQCKSGARSMEVTQLMRGAGFKARNLHGGINAYARQVDDSIPTY